jgi:CRP-like cAMP-binding protein
LTAEEDEVRALVFRDLPSKKVLQVIGIGTWVSAAPRERLIELGPGEIVGSALLLSGAPAEIDAVTTDVTRTIRWNAATLERYLDANPETRNLLQRHLARDLAGKVERLAGDFSRTV